MNSMTQKELGPGDLLGRYELLMPIAKGGMASVWLARLSGTRGFRKIVAVKTILRGSIDDARLERMFIEEAMLVGQIHHSNVVQVLDFGEHDGTLFIAMEWVEGEPLQRIVAEGNKRGGLPMAVSINIVGQVCKGLHAAHELRDDSGALLGLVHRDISPQNVMVSYAGTAKVLDFGIAKATARGSMLTEAGEVKGKFAYMSPEQLCGRPLDRRSDVFSLGVLAYMLTTNRHPFRGEHTGETMSNICSRAPDPPSSAIADYPPRLEAALLKAIAKDPQDRWATTLEFLAALEEAMPACLESVFEAELALYMNDLFAQRVSERRLQLRIAEERTGHESPPTSVAGGSLKAVSIDGEQTQQGAGEADAAAFGSGSAVHAAMLPWIARSPRLLIGGLMLSGILAVSFGLSLVFSIRDQPVARVEVATRAAAPSTGAPAVASATPRAAVASGLPPESSTKPTLTGARLPVNRRATAARPQSGSASPPSRGEPALAASSPGPLKLSPSASAPGVDSWDPSNFGGRY